MKLISYKAKREVSTLIKRLMEGKLIANCDSINKFEGLHEIPKGGGGELVFLQSQFFFIKMNLSSHILTLIFKCIYVWAFFLSHLESCFTILSPS